MLALACAGGRPAGGAGSAPSPAKEVPLAQALVLETTGAPPPDTSVTFTAGEPRTILLLHGPPDNVGFAELAFGPSAFADSGREVVVRIHPRPGVYGVDVESTLPIQSGVTVTFKYPRYFSAPARARQIYGSDAAFERALAVGRLLPDGRIAFLPSVRPASDNLQAPLPSSGSYLVAAAQ